VFNFKRYRQIQPDIIEAVQYEGKPEQAAMIVRLFDNAVRVGNGNIRFFMQYNEAFDLQPGDYIAFTDSGCVMMVDQKIFEQTYCPEYPPEVDNRQEIFPVMTYKIH